MLSPNVCWLIEPEQRWVEVRDAARDGARLAADGAIESAALPGFRLEVRTLWGGGRPPG